eukprot:TRINITY_DN800_c0_g1_i4.p1 TRINITY_DN800_c0_g1~~TRINITY_DN800_c0_g1_i4.p1  ORF type:complete len:332 (+),score=29.29 TRINITY_DN800_c0_g1_i4:88-1083(+)
MLRKNSLNIHVFGKDFKNPLGLAAGFDKNGEAVGAMLNLGFGFVEAGTVTPLAQSGNDKPRCWRLPSLQAVVNRMGFNNQGIHTMHSNLRKFRTLQAQDSYLMQGIVGINIGKNKQTELEHAFEDYVRCCTCIVKDADYVVINVSSPNTPGLRTLQSKDELTKIIQSVKQVIINKGVNVPLLVKISPDLSQPDLENVAFVVLKEDIDGLIVTNTTLQRPNQYWQEVDENKRDVYIGGLSGRPLKELSTQVISQIYKLTEGKIPIIGCGGIENGKDAYDKIRAGASLLQIYTAMIYQGISVVPNIKQQLVKCLLQDGFTSLEQAVGADHRSR